MGSEQLKRMMFRLESCKNMNSVNKCVALAKFCAGVELELEAAQKKIAELEAEIKELNEENE